MERTIGMRILITEPENYSQQALELYKQFGNVFLLPDLKLDLKEAIVDFDVIVIRLKYYLNDTLLEKTTKLKFIISPTTGLDHINEACATKKGITIISLRGETSFLNSISSTAEFTWTLLLSLLKRLPPAVQHVAAGGWNRNLFKGNNLQGKKLGILGLGRVGKQVADFAKAFGMQIMAFDTNPSIVWPENVLQADNAGQLFSWCNILSIHIPAFGNDGYVSANLLQMLRPDSFIINTSRGSVWDETSVARLLINNQLAGVATDVLGGELDNDARAANPLLTLAGKLPNLVITPHIAGATYESMASTEYFVAEKFTQLVKA